MHAFFMRTYFIRILKTKLNKKLRISQEYTHLELLLTELRKYFYFISVFILSKIYLGGYICQF